MTLYGPKCRYNLTGLIEHRCPECGTPFDPERLRALQAQPRCPWRTCARIAARFFAAPALFVALLAFDVWAEPRVSTWRPHLGAAMTLLTMAAVVVMIHNSANLAAQVIRAPYKMFGGRSYTLPQLILLLTLIAILAGAQVGSFLLFIHLTTSPMH